MEKEQASAAAAEFVPAPSTLYLVSTPIGNLSDLSERARMVMAGVDAIACEDTRVTRGLLQRFGIQAETYSYREENESRLAPILVEQLKEGATLALVSDAGTPTLSDPGFRLVRECRRHGIAVVPIPGPFAAVVALSASGLPTDRFFYAGFLQPRKSARQRFLQEHKDFPHTIVLYESCHRILKFLADSREVLGEDRVVCVAREITKRFETFHVGPLREVIPAVEFGSRKGEFVVAIAPDGYQL